MKRNAMLWFKTQLEQGIAECPPEDEDCKDVLKYFLAILEEEIECEEIIPMLKLGGNA